MVFLCLLCLILVLVWGNISASSFLSTPTWAGTQRKETSTPVLCSLYIWFGISSKISCLHEFSDWMLESVEILSVTIVTLYWLLLSTHCVYYPHHFNCIHWEMIQCPVFNAYIKFWNENCCSSTSCFIWSICEDEKFIRVLLMYIVLYYCPCQIFLVLFLVVSNNNLCLILLILFFVQFLCQTTQNF